MRLLSIVDVFINQGKPQIREQVKVHVNMFKFENFKMVEGLKRDIKQENCSFVSKFYVNFVLSLSSAIIRNYESIYR